MRQKLPPASQLAPSDKDNINSVVGYGALSVLIFFIFFSIEFLDSFVLAFGYVRSAVYILTPVANLFCLFKLLRSLTIITKSSRPIAYLALAHTGLLHFLIMSYVAIVFTVAFLLIPSLDR